MDNVIDFVKSIYLNKEFIPLFNPTFQGNEKKYLNQCVDSKNVASTSPFVNQFEQSIINYTGVKHAIATINGTSALHLALLLLKVQSGKEVITQPLTYVATANAISYTGAKPIFIDVDKKSLGLSPDKLEQFLESETIVRNGKCFNKTTSAEIKAILPMHTFGLPSRIDEIVSIGNKHNIPVMEDAAEGLGSFFKNQHIGTYGEMGILSFNGNKTITTGGGGMLLTNDKRLAELALHLSTTGKIKHPYEQIHDHIGYNYRMPGINAALGLAQIEQLEEILNLKKQLSDKYKAYFKNTDLEFINAIENGTSNHWVNVIAFDSKHQRDEFVELLNRNNINIRPAWTLMNHLKMFSNCQTGNLDNAIDAQERIALLPSGVDNTFNLK